jgi:hypothetical protein
MKLLAPIAATALLVLPVRASADVPNFHYENCTACIPDDPDAGDRTTDGNYFARDDEEAACKRLDAGTTCASPLSAGSARCGKALCERTDPSSGCNCHFGGRGGAAIGLAASVAVVLAALARRGR